jgi:hypothetical protein
MNVIYPVDDRVEKFMAVPQCHLDKDLSFEFRTRNIDYSLIAYF